MTLTKTLLYDVGGNLTFDNTKVEVVGGKAQLKLAFSGVEDFSEDFADDTDHVYDNTKAEFTGGLIRQKDQTPANSVKAVTFPTNANPITTEAALNWRKSGGALTATLNGAPTIVGGKLVCAGVQGVYYGHTTTAVETHKFRYTPNYSTSPPTNVNMISNYNGTNNNDRWAMTNSPSGNNLRIGIYNSTGTSVISLATTVGSYAPVAGQTDEIEVVINSTLGTVRIFVNGTLIGTLTPGAWTRGGVSTRLYLGANPIVYNTAQGSFDDYIGFSNAQHTATYSISPAYTIVPTIYAETNDCLPLFTYSGPGLLKAAGAPSATEVGAPRYLIQNKYWDGDSWEDSDESYAQSTSLADIITNIATFPSTGASQIEVKVVFAASNTLSSVSQIDFAVQGQFYPTDNPTVFVTAFTLVDDLSSFEADFDFAGSDTVKFLLVLHTTSSGAAMPMYWTGSAWAASDGTYAQSNTVAEINTNIDSLDVSDGLYLRVYAFLHSEDSLTTPALTNVVFNYSFYSSRPTPNKCILNGWLGEVNCEPLVGTVTICNLTPFYHGELLVPVSQIQVETNDAGYWEVELIETETVSKSYKVIIEYTDEKAKPVTYQAIEIPDQESKAISEYGVPA